jgi:hypothetical protein
MFFLFTIEKASAIPTKPVAKPVQKAFQIDSSTIAKHSFNDAALQRYAKQKEFIYQDAPAEGKTLWQRFWSWVWRILGNIFRTIKGDTASWFLFRMAFYVIALIALGFIIFKLAGIDVFKILKGESKNIEIPYGESLENIHDINFDGEIDNAIANRNYRLAVRLLYLRSLKQLSDAHLIHWQIEKTNTSYLTELADTEYRQLFGLLTTQFEYIWYGDFPVDGQSFQNINALFIDFKKGLP